MEVRGCHFIYSLREKSQCTILYKYKLSLLFHQKKKEINYFVQKKVKKIVIFKDFSQLVLGRENLFLINIKKYRRKFMKLTKSITFLFVVLMAVSNVLAFSTTSIKDERLNLTSTTQSAKVAIKRLRDGVIVTRAGATYPNDRVARGEAYQVRVRYWANSLSSHPYDIMVLTRANGNVIAAKYFKAYTTSGYNQFTWNHTVSHNPSFSNVYYEVYNRHNVLLTSQRLPIGSY